MVLWTKNGEVHLAYLMEQHKAKGRVVGGWAELCAQVTFTPSDAHPFWKGQEEGASKLAISRVPFDMDFYEPGPP